MKTLLFVYNANSGLGNTILDMGHKIFSPSTYPCKLCDITYGIFTENEVWKVFRSSTDLNLQFYHIDEFEEKFPQQTFKYPIILTSEGNDLKHFMTSEDIDALKNAEDLIHAIKLRTDASEIK